MACSSGCATKDHSSYAECLRGKSCRVAYCNSVNGWDYSRQKSWDAELARYRGAVRDGLNPESCTNAAIDKAIARAESSGIGGN